MIIDPCRQGDESWFLAHAGVLGASSADQVLTTNGDQSKSRQKLIYRLAGELLIGRREEGFSSAAMARGVEMEEEARLAFSFITGIEVEQVGFVYADESRRWGCSPDGLIAGARQGLEIKCPTLPVHVEYLVDGKLPTAYFQQVQASLAATGYESWHFWSYYPGCPPLHIVVGRDEAWIEAYRKAAECLCCEVSTVYERISGAGKDSGYSVQS